MTSENQLEEDLRQQLAAATGMPVADQRFHDAAIQRAVQANRRRRVTRIAVCGASAAMTAAVLIGASQLDLGRKGHVAAQPIASSSTSTVYEGVWQWANNLPHGETTSLTFLAGSTLHNGASTIDTHGSDVGYTGEVAGGHLVLVEDRATDGALTSRYKIIADNGSVQSLPDSHFQAQGAVISPDGSQVAYGSEVYDITKNQVVASLPERAMVLEAWTNQGVVFSDSGAGSYIWRPGHPAVAFETTPGTVVNPRGFALLRREGCSTVKQVQGDGTASAIWEECSGTALIAVSPDGTLAVEADSRTVSTGSGETLSQSLPEGLLLQDNAAVGWEGNTRLVFSVEGPQSRDQVGNATGSRPAILVGCDLMTGACQLVSDELSLDSEDMLQIQ